LNRLVGGISVFIVMLLLNVSIALSCLFYHYCCIIFPNVAILFAVHFQRFLLIYLLIGIFDGLKSIY